MDLAKLAILKNKMINGTEFSDAFTYFMDHFGEDPAFLDEGKPGRNHLLEASINRVIAQLTGSNSNDTAFIIIQSKKKGFLHGSVVTGVGMGMFFYFDDVQMGILVSHFPSLGPGTTFTRFTGMATKSPENARNN